MRVLVTGLDGFTGRYIRPELEQHGHSVVGLKADLNDPQALSDEIAAIQPESVIHLAGISFVGHGNINAFYQVNLVGTRNLLAALSARADTLKSILLASSANVYGNTREGVLDESMPLCPANDYAVSKLAMEYMARLWMDRLPIIIARPFNYTGIGQSESFLLPKIVAHFRRGEKCIELGNLDVTRDFCDVRAVANAYRRLIESPARGVTLNVCSGRSHSLREAVAMAEQIAGYPVDIRVNPAFVRDNEVRILLGSAQCLRDTIGEWDTPPLRDTLEWMFRSSASAESSHTSFNRLKTNGDHV